MNSRGKRVVRWTIAAVVFGLLLAKFFVLDFWVIPQNGMFPTLPGGSRFLARRHAYASPSQVQRGDIVIFNQLVNGKNYQFIWRVIGMPEDHVVISGHDVAVNNKPLAHEQLRTYAGGTIYRESDGVHSYEIAVETNPAQPAPSIDLTVPDDQFFLLGDNRDAAVDSRYRGPVPFSAIVARKVPAE